MSNRMHIDAKYSTVCEVKFWRKNPNKKISVKQKNKPRANITWLPIVKFFSSHIMEGIKHCGVASEEERALFAIYSHTWHVQYSTVYPYNRRRGTHAYNTIPRPIHIGKETSHDYN